MTQIGRIRHAMTRAELLALPPSIDVVTAGRAFGLGRTTTYALVRKGEFPCEVIKAGGVYRAVTADLFRVLRIVPENNEPAGAATPAGSSERTTETA